MDIHSVMVEHQDPKEKIYCSGILLNNYILFPASTILASNLELQQKTKDISGICTTNYLDICPKNTTIYMEPNSGQLENHPLEFLSLLTYNDMKTSTPLALSPKYYNINEQLEDISSLVSLFVVGSITKVDGNVENMVISFLDNIKTYCCYPNKMQGIYIQSTPFGNKEMFGSVNKGIVSGVFGVNNCYFITDAPSAPGSEGGPVYTLRKKNRRTKLTGLVVSCLNLVQGEHTGLTLAISLFPLITQYIPTRSVAEITNVPSNVKSFVDTSIVKIHCGRLDTGSAILIDKKNAIFLTAAHVVENAPEQNIRLEWELGTFTARLIFKSTYKRSAYDIALVQSTPQEITEMTEMKFANDPVEKGENILSGGYPQFSHKKRDKKPTITSGNVINCNPHVIYTDCPIANGASGGAVVRYNGELLGIIVCHIRQKSNGNEIIYSRFNMSIPISAIKDSILKYIETKDEHVLTKLNCVEVDVLRKWNIFHSKL